MNERQPLAGRLTLRLVDTSGRVCAERQADNEVTDNGRNLVARLFAGDLKGHGGLFMVVGSDKSSLLPERGDEEAKLPDRVKASEVKVSDAVVTISATFPEREDKQALTAAGIAVKLGEGEFVLYNHVAFDVITKPTNMKMTLSWDINFGAGAS